MKMTFRPNIKTSRKKRRYLVGALIALILVIIVFPDFSFRIVGRPLFVLVKPLLEVKTSLLKKWEDISISTAEKQKIFDENKALREKTAELEVKIALLGPMEKENAMLKEVLSAEEKREFILASIISRPPQIIYDMLIIDAGSSNGVKEGMAVTAFGNVLLGYVTDVFDDASKVKLISSFGEETNAIMESSGISVIAVGKSGENFEIMLPRAISVNAGERIITMGKRPMLVGIVERIEHQTTDPLQKIIFRLPINTQYLNSVFLLKK